LPGIPFWEPGLLLRASPRRRIAPSSPSLCFEHNPPDKEYGPPYFYVEKALFDVISPLRRGTSPCLSSSSCLPDFSVQCSNLPATTILSPDLPPRFFPWKRLSTSRVTSGSRVPFPGTKVYVDPPWNERRVQFPYLPPPFLSN